MPEISRFFGIIIRMYVELGVPHHHPHLHAYYQNAVGVYRIDEIEMIEGTLSRRNNVSWRHGLSCIKMNFWRTGKGYKPVRCHSRSHPSSRKKA